MLNANWTFLPLAFAVLLLQFVAILALVFTGSWQTPAPGFMIAITPLFGWAGGLSRALVPESVFSGYSAGYTMYCAANVYAYAMVQWIGLGLALDLVRNRK